MRFILTTVCFCLFALAFWKQKPDSYVSLPSLTYMPAWRKTAVSLFLFAFIVFSTLVTLLSRQAWPIVRYRIYDKARLGNTVTGFRLVGTAEDGSDFPFLDNRYMAPFDPSRLLGIVSSTLRSANGQATLDAMVADLYARYEKRRQEHQHDGPPLVGLRLVRDTYTVTDPRVVAVGHPDQREVLAEYATVRQPQTRSSR